MASNGPLESPTGRVRVASPWVARDHLFREEMGWVWERFLVGGPQNTSSLCARVSCILVSPYPTTPAGRVYVQVWPIPRTASDMLDKKLDSYQLEAGFALADSWLTEKGWELRSGALALPPLAVQTVRESLDSWDALWVRL